MHQQGLLLQGHLSTAAAVVMLGALLSGSAFAAQPNVKTPNIDRLAARDMLFSNAHCAAPVFNPSRVATLTGRRPGSTGIYDNSAKWHEAIPNIASIPQHFKANGYHVMGGGKVNHHMPGFNRSDDWHRYFDQVFDGHYQDRLHRGLDVSNFRFPDGFPLNGLPSVKALTKPPKNPREFDWGPLDKNDLETGDGQLVQWAIDFLKQTPDKPFFLYFPHYGVHSPLQAPEKLTKKYERVPKAKRQGKPVYAAMVESIDNSVGRVLDALRASGKEDNTVIIFTSDNGGFYKATSNAPLRANKGSYYEGGIRVPLIIKWPGASHAGRVIHEAVISNDLYPTCLSAAGVELNPNQHMDGVNLKPLLSATEDLPRVSLFWHFPHYNKHPSSHPSSVIRKGDWKLIESFDPATVELYDLGQDLGETINLAQSEPARRNELLQELDTWRVAVGAERMKPNPDAASKDNREDTTAQ